MKFLCVDPGQVRIGIAISDETGTLARPLTILKHVSREADAISIMKLALQYKAEVIVVGEPLGSDGQRGPKARSAAKLAEALRALEELPVTLWDESHSSQKAADLRIAYNVPKKKRSQPVDDLAAAVILQDYLDNHKANSECHASAS